MKKFYVINVFYYKMMLW